MLYTSVTRCSVAHLFSHEMLLCYYLKRLFGHIIIIIYISILEQMESINVLIPLKNIRIDSFERVQH